VTDPAPILSQIAPSSSLDLRAQLETLALNDLLGPAGGPAELLDDRSVRGRYILGLLAPQRQSALPTERERPRKATATAAAGDEADDLPPDDAELAEAGADTPDGKPASPVASVQAMLPSSLGLTFSVAADTPALTITARWGQYRRVRTEQLRDDQGQPKLVWQRRPVEGVVTIPLAPGKLGPWYPDPENEGVFVEGRVRQRVGAWTITLFLINGQVEPKQSKDEAWVFQPELSVAAPEGAPAFVRRPLPDGFNPYVDPEDRAMAMLYRRQLEFAVGHGVGVRVTPAATPARDRAVQVETEIVPSYEVERMEAPTPADIPALAAAVTDMQVLAGLPDAEFPAALGPLAEAYEAWISAQEARLANPAPDLAAYAVSGAEAVRQCRLTLGRIRAGLALLAGNPQAAEAFRFVNRAMWQQRVRSLYARGVRRSAGQGETPTPEQFDLPANRRWYPFQLAFILLNLPGLVDPTHLDRSHPTDAKADLLWFPTGGGKTEAYLGVAAFTLALRRLTDTAPGQRRGRGRADALHPALAHTPAVPARRRAAVRV